MSSLAFLVTELQSLASESRRKHPEIREAAEKSLAILRSSPEQATASLASDGAQSNDLLRPVFMGCATKNAKVVAISLGSLQRLIALKAVPQSAVPSIISTMSDAMSQGVDIQLRILQTLVSLITNFPSVHGELLAEALLLCFKLQDSRIAVVSSTAAATLRQMVMFVVDKMVEEDKRESLDPKLLKDVILPDGTTAALGPFARDAYSVFEDLCLLANSEKPNFLNLDFLHKTFALELIESVLTNYHELFRKHEQLLLLLRHHLCPMLLKTLSDRAVFPLTLRCTRVVFLLLKQFSFELKTEAEVFLVLLIRMISEDADTAPADHSPSRPVWTRVLAMEIMRGLCSDAELIRNIWDRYDAQESGSNVFSSLISSLKRLVTEKPALLGVSSQMMGVGALSNPEGGSSYGLDVGGMAGMVANAAATAASCNCFWCRRDDRCRYWLERTNISNEATVSHSIDQLDKADSPPIPESYVYLLGVQCIVSLCEGFASFTGPLYTSIAIQRPRTAGDPVIRAPPALDLAALPLDEPATRHLRIVRSMVDNGWPALLAALSFIISTNLSDELFVDVLTSYQAMTNVAGMLALTTPRDAFLTSLAKFAIPSRVVASLESYIEPPTPRSGASLTENLGLTAPVQPPGLSERNLVCLKVLVSSAHFLAGSLGENWVRNLLEGDQVVFLGTPSRSSSGATGGTSEAGKTSHPPQPARHPLLAEIDPENVQLAIQRLFEASKNLEDSAFQDFVNALCRLSSEMIGMQSDAAKTLGEAESTDELASSVSSATLSPRNDLLHRRRVSGIHLPRTLRSGDFGVERLGTVAMLNIHRLIYRAPEVAWNTTTGHLLSIISLPSAPQAIRVQAARVLDEILVVVPRNLSNAGDLQAQGQRRVLDVLSKQIVPGDEASATAMSTNVELRRMGLEALHQILQASGHTLVVGWGSIFEMLGSVCKPPVLMRTTSIDSVSTLSLHDHRPKPLILGYNNERGYTALVKIAFQSLKLFGRQADTNIALTAAESLLWSVSDSIQAKRKDAEKEAEYSELWMFLLLEVLGLYAWKVFVAHIQDTVLLDRRPLSTPALQCLDKAVGSLSEATDNVMQPRVAEALECAWQAWNDLGSAVLEGGMSLSSPRGADDVAALHRAFTQESLVAYLDVIRTIRRMSRQHMHTEWPLTRLTRLMEILKGVLMYPNSPDYRPDVDALTPVQASVIDIVQSIDLAEAGVPSLIMRDLSEFSALALLVGLNAMSTLASVPGSPATPGPASTRKQVTYIGLSKKTMPTLVEMYMRFKNHVEIYQDGTLEAVLSAYGIPIKLKYECPAPSKFGNDVPLWKTATTCFLRMVTECVTGLSRLGEVISDTRVEAIWRQIIEGFRGGILADCSLAETFSLEEQEVEENFDLALISSLEIDLIPHLGGSRPVVQAYRSTATRSGSPSRGEQSHAGSSRNSREEFEKVDLESVGSTAPGEVVPRERFSYWCFDLLFLICSNVTNGGSRGGEAASGCVVLAIVVGPMQDGLWWGISRMRRFVVVCLSQGDLVREDELLYVLRKLLDLRLWPGTLWAALSDAPSANSASPPAVDPSLPPSALVADVVKRSSVGHLFYFYPVLCEIASIPRKTPAAWVLAGGSVDGGEPDAWGARGRIGAPEGDGRVVEVDARALAKACLGVLGKEMGAV
ncbi:guanine nucleotide exchange factor in Golgi transport N-terminal-domain-containing protein [Chiua virens]|nr:guanine nucleotide exchange factor in Golgi transport N-terminal-domain-containing protein [Chiua virens]